MAEPKKTYKKKTASEAVSVSEQGLTIKVALDKTNQFGGQRIVVKVSLLKDGKEISSDSDYVLVG